MRRPNYQTVETTARAIGEPKQADHSIARPVRQISPAEETDSFDTPWRIVTGFIGSLMPIGANLPWLGIRGQWRLCPMRPVKSAIVYCGVPAAFMFFGGCMASRVNQNPQMTGNPFVDSGYTAGVKFINPSVDAGLSATGQTIQVLWNVGETTSKTTLVRLDSAMQGGQYTPAVAGQQAQLGQMPQRTAPAAPPIPGVTTVNFSNDGGK